MGESKQLDQSKMDAFMGKMIGIYNAGALNLMISIGHRTGLFDTMAEMHPSTSKEIALQAGLNERYVREWLGAMVAGRIVDYNNE
ncbi:MAG: transcriptional regulator, partial [Thermodesulfobacteriota bacterium]